jgi:outer membrane protein OmpA-like peptidoglycan-associated protein
MHRAGALLIISSAALVLCVATASAQVPIAGVDVGIAEPANRNYRAQVETGATVNPYVGYMFNEYLGVQAQGHVTLQTPDNDGRGFGDENQTTTLLGATVGPRLAVPLGELTDLYLTGQGGAFKGVSGRLNQTAPGVSLGGGLDFNVSRNISLGLFGRWNRAYMAPHPIFLAGQAPADQGPHDARWLTAGVGFTYAFREPEPAPPTAPPPPPPPTPAPPKKKIVLRSVHFDSDKADVRPDAIAVLDEAAQILKDESGILVVVEGYTDSNGSEPHNRTLSQHRAQAVRQYLIDHGVSERRLRAEGLGDSRPVATNDTEDGRAQNRRVELHVQ